MAIVTESYYTDTFMGFEVATEDFAQYDAFAERAIARVTRGRVTESNFFTLPAWVQTAYQNAICSQISYYAVYGVDSALMGLSGESYTVGKVSVNGGSRFPVGQASIICADAMAYLEQTGLTHPQVETVGSAFLPFWYGQC